MRTAVQNSRRTAPAAMVFYLLITFALPLASAAADLPHHDITVSIDPAKLRLSATDTITLPRDFPRVFTFALHAGLKPTAADRNVRITRKSDRRDAVPLELFTVTLPEGVSGFTVKYAGSIYHPLVTGGNQARGLDQTPGSIADDGVYLAGSSAWHPLLETGFMTFSLSVNLPSGWSAVSQGSRMFQDGAREGAGVGWDSPEPQSEIYLIASRFSHYEKKDGTVTAEVYLRVPDDALARTKER